MKQKTSAIYGIGGLLALALAGCGGGDDTPAPSLSLSGKVVNATTFTSASLKEKYTEVTQDVSYLAGTTPQSKTYLGVPLFDVVQNALATDNNTPGATNTGNAGRRLIEHYVLSSATDGYQVVYALGELSPNFGGNQPPNQPLIAYAQKVNGTVTPLDDSTDGPFRVTAPGDIRGGRYASNVTKLEVGVPAPTPMSGVKPGGQSTTIVVNGKVKAARTFTVDDLKALTAKTATYNGTTYRGAGLYDLLNATVGLTTSSTGRNNAALSLYAVATATDGFRAVVSLGEIHPNFGNRPAIVAYETESGAGLGNAGALRLIIAKNPTTPETMGARQVSNLVEIQVFEAGTP
ncbi:molybdopterin-binding oxidoreductase [Pseudorhodoferax sp.]|uniref:molybdopterin-binding oxidoreductase n=1 Tax=Pseudorhodoferax sp. TaxID=1993553 RepID=UPI002DD646DD|nr:molybdopterin-binding oxidoreductase [Pseudorhodoferax sp.]